MSTEHELDSNHVANSSMNDGKSDEEGNKFPDELIFSDSSSAATVLYSNKSSLSSPKESSSKGLKGVSFSMQQLSFSSTDEKYGGSNSNTIEELQLKTKEELVELVVFLQGKNETLKVDYSGEKALRRKKEKNMIRLAKQLNVTSTERNDLNSHVSKLIADEKILETQLHQCKSELETAHTISSKAARDHDNEINDLQAKNRALQTEYQDTIARITSENGKQVEQLRRQILQSQLEGDRLRVELAGFKMQAEAESTRRIDDIVEKTLRDHDNQEKEMMTKKSNIFGCFSSIKVWRIVGFFFGAILIPSIAIAHKMDLLSKSSVCAPAMPGTYLHSNLSGDYKFEAPWWMFPSMKKQSFDWFCAKRRRTKIEWLPTGKPNEFKLVVIDLNKVGEKKSGKVTNGQVFERRATSITLHSDAITYENTKGGKQERRRAPWVPSRNPLRK